MMPENNAVESLNFKRLEITSKIINGEQHFYIIDCDKSFCNFCEKKSCSLDFFFNAVPEKASLLINEIYQYETARDPKLKDLNQTKDEIVLLILKKCSGHDHYYDFLFRGDKLISVRFDSLNSLS